MDERNKRQVVLVTGSAQGIGRVIVDAFAEDGAMVVGLDLPGGAISAQRAEFESAGTGTAFEADVRDSAALRGIVEEVARRFGRIDVLVNNAGINVTGPVDEMDDDAWDRCFQINVGGVYRMSKAVIPAMKRQEGGRIINAASFAALIPSVDQAAYAASKAAVTSFTRTLAGELGPWNITVNAYAPGMIPSAMNGFADMPEGAQSALLDTLTLRRWGRGEDVANLIRFLASEEASYITGTLIDVSGGKYATQFPARAHERRASKSGL